MTGFYLGQFLNGKAGPLSVAPGQILVGLQALGVGFSFLSLFVFI